MVHPRLARRWIPLCGRERAPLRCGAERRRKDHVFPVPPSQSSCASQRRPRVEVAQAGSSSRPSDMSQPQAQGTLQPPTASGASHCSAPFFSSGHIRTWSGRGGHLLPPLTFPALVFLDSCAEWQLCNSMMQLVRRIWSSLDCRNLILKKAQISSAWSRRVRYLLASAHLSPLAWQGAAVQCLFGP